MTLRRNHIKKGDETTSGGVVLQGIEGCYHDGTELTHLGAAVRCPRCERTGKIAPTGPRWPGNMMGKTPALEGDLCLCGCEPPPVLVVSQTDMAQQFENDPSFYSGATANIEQGVAFYPWRDRSIGNSPALYRQQNAS